MAVINILIVEDEAITAMEIQKIMQSKGYNSHITYSGEEAVKKAVQIKPDLILMDIKLQGGSDGIKIAEKITKFMDVPVIYLSALSDNKTMELAKSTKHHAYVFKPFKGSELTNIIKNALYKHEKLK